ncbi:TPA: TatD family hydrolase [Candidatus Galligastranaerophilus faecipullorum]|nr:TatD family hydrolase [Candidatus Galligastranaerophilus faecipullorum]
MIIDTHAHLDMLNDPKRAIEEALEAGVEKIIVPGVEPDTFEKVIKLADEYENVYAQVGVHPSEAQKFSDDTAGRMMELAAHKKVVAIGEIGLDYYWDKTFVDVQKKVFKTQIEIANALKLPVVVHDREAHGDTFEILEQMGAKKVLLHCFSGSLEFAKRCVEKGWFIALGGVVTFKNAKKVRQVAKEIPLEHIMLETDTPYLTPHPYRGEENAPKYIVLSAKEIANLKDTALSEVERVTTANAQNFFNV